MRIGGHKPILLPKGLKMSTVTIQKKVKIVSDSEGKPVEVILPYEVYQELLELQISLEIYQQVDTQESLQRAKKEIGEGKTVSFKNSDEAGEWLDK